MFRADPDRDRSAVPDGHVPADRKPRAAFANKDSGAVLCAMRPFMKFIAGEPMKPATNTFLGRS